MSVDPELTKRAKAIKGIVFDVDGVLTDGRIIYSSDGTESKQFHVQDGASIKLLMDHNLEIAIITGRRSPVVERRASELGIKHIVQGASSKSAALDKLITNGFPSDALCVVGDDLQDLALFHHSAVLLCATVANAHPAVLEQAQFVTQRAGGEGIVVEIAQLLLKAQERWEFS